MAIGRIPEPGTGIPESIVDAKGDIVTATAADTPARLAVGSNEQRLVADSAAATGLKYVADTTNYAIAAKGDLLVGTGADTLAALTVGTNGHTLVADSGETTGLRWAAPAGGGKVLQVVSATTTTTTTITSTSYTDTGLSASITPSSATSKILILTQQPGRSTRANTDLPVASLRLMRASTEIQQLDAINFAFAQTSDTRLTSATSMAYLDSPNTTSATTYKTQGRVSTTGDSASFILQPSTGVTSTSSIILLEIGA